MVTVPFSRLTRTFSSSPTPPRYVESAGGVWSLIGRAGGGRHAGSVPVTTRVAGAPAILTSRQAPETAARRGTVLVYHGFGGDKLALEDLAAALADAGFLAVRVDI